MNSFKLYAAALLTVASAGALTVAVKRNNDFNASHCNKNTGLCRLSDEETPGDKALDAAWTVNSWNVVTTLNSVPRDDEGWKPVDVNGTKSEFQIKPPNDEKEMERGCTLTTVREIAPPKKILAADELVCR
jgi:hypothetical protein